MSSKNPKFKCANCSKHHSKQAFISHAQNDTEIVNILKQACCEREVTPFLYEYSPEFHTQYNPADTLAEAVAASEVIIVLLGQSVSEAYWTQAWIGFEVGISKGLSITGEPKSVIVLQDIRQGTKASVPMLDAIFLFDFDSDKGWEQYKDLIMFLAKLDLNGGFYKAANSFRSAAITANVKCGNCKSEYESWIAKSAVYKLGKGFNPIKVNAVWQAECTIECPSCDKAITRHFMEMLP